MSNEVSYDGVGLHPHIIKELVNSFLGGFGWRRLSSSNVGQSHEDVRVDCLGIVEKTANNLLDALLAGVVQEGNVVGWIGCLIILAMYNWVWCKRGLIGMG